MLKNLHSVSIISLMASLAAMGAVAETAPQADDTAGNSTGELSTPDETTDKAADKAAVMNRVVVTAQRREQLLQDVPISISAFDESAIEDAKVETLADFNARVPNASLSPVGAFTFASAFSIRGLGFADVESTFEPTVGVEIDGVYLARNVNALLDLYDVESVEVLRGPQGTLYGRNTIGGVVSVRTARPGDKLSGKFQLTGGNYGRREARGSIGGPITNILSGKVSALFKNYDGYYDNVDGQKMPNDGTRAVRGTLVLDPGNGFDATLIADSAKLDGTGLPFENASLPGQVLPLFGFPADDDGEPFKTYVGDRQGYDLDTKGMTLEMNQETGLGKLTSITGYRETDQTTESDFDGEQVRFLQVDRDESHEQLSEEVRLAGGAGALNYVVGAYFLSQSYDLTNHQYGLIFGGPDAGSTVHAAQDNTAYAGFGQLDYEIVDGLTVTAGLRYSWEKKKFTVQPLFYPVEQSFSASFDNLSPKIGISYKPNEDLMLYASYTRGFRAGGFNGRAASFEVVGPYDPETVSSYEAGLKSQLLDGRLTFNLGGFVANYKDQQVGVQEIDPVTLVNQTLVRNAASSKMQGIELESELQAGGGFSFSASVGYLDASFDKFVADLGDGLGVIDRSNLPLSYAPEWTTGVTANWDGKTAWGDVTAQMSVLNQSDQYTSFSPTNLLSDFAVRDANTLVNASLALRTDYGVTFRLWGKNLGDETVINNTFAVGALLTARVYQPPREFGIDLAYEF